MPGREGGKKKYEKTVQILDIRSKKEDKTVDTM